MSTSHRPVDGTPVGTVPDSTPQEVTAAVAAAVAAAEAMAEAPPARRRVWLEAAAVALEAASDVLAVLADAETGLGLPRCSSELARAASQLRFYAAVAVEGSYLGVTLDGPTPGAPALARVNRPLGPIAVFGASNFPFGFGVLGNDTASALAAGCPVVAKAHPAHVTLCVRLAEVATTALAAAGAPSGAVGLVVGLDAGQWLVQADGITGVGFTGSQTGGLTLWRLANERPVVIPVYAEMGTVNPAVLTRAATARLEEIAEGFVASYTLGSGQFCTKPGLLLAPAGHAVAQAVAKALEALGPRPVMLTRGIAEATTVGIDRLTTAGAEVVAEVGPRPGEEGSGWHAPAAVLSARASALVPGSPLLEEVFGAVALVVEYADAAELEAALSALQGSLAGTVVTDGTGADPYTGRLVRTLAAQVGRVTVDDWPTGVAWTWAQQHGGPWPATSAPATTSVGAAALSRWVRPVAYQSVPDAFLPPPVQQANPWSLPRRVDGRLELPGAVS